MEKLKKVMRLGKRCLASILCLLMVVSALSVVNLSEVFAAGEGLKIQMYNSNAGWELNTVYPNFMLVNTGTQEVNLSDVKIRYYYTIDSNFAQSFICDYSNVGSTNVTGNFYSMSSPTTDADYYLEVGFLSSAGSIAAGTSVEIQGRFMKSNWDNYNQVNDYSFNPMSTSYVDWSKATVYVSNELKWGLVPGQSDNQQPTAPASLNVTSKTSTSITLSWTASTDDIGVAGYKITRSDGFIATTANTTFTDTGLQTNTYYSYKVQAYDAANNYSDESNETGQITNPSARKINVVKLVDDGAATLTYTPDYYDSPYYCFDGDISTLFVGATGENSPNNPAFVKVSFTNAQTINKTNIFIGQPGYSFDTDAYKIEAADSESDLTNKSGTYINVVPGTSTPEFKPGTTDPNAYDTDTFSPVTKKIWKVTVKRIDSLTHVHIPEIEFWGNSGTTNIIDGISNVNVQPFYSTAKLTWNKLTNSNVAGYAIYRRSSNGTYDYQNPTGRIANDSNQNTITFNDFNLTPGADYYYRIAAFDTDGFIISSYSTEVGTTLLSSNSNLSRTTSLKLLVPIYTGNMSGVSTDRLINSIKEGISFYYRNTTGKLNLEPTFMVINGVLGGRVDGVPGELKARGIFLNEYDGVFVIAANTGSFTGGYGEKNQWLGAHGGQGFSTDYGFSSAAWETKHTQGQIYGGQLWGFLHEFCHAMDSMADDGVLNPANAQFFIDSDINQGYPQVNQNIPNFNAGFDSDLISQILRSFDGYDQLEAPHNDYIEYVDTDHDGLADTDSRLPMDEVRFGSSETESDTDSDGLSDLGEYSASYSTGSDPNIADTDEDGMDDVTDPTPLCDFSPYIMKFTTPPDLQNGTIDSSWTFLGSKPVHNMDDTLDTEFYSGWDDDYLYIGAKSNKKIQINLSLDGSGHNGFPECDGYFVQDNGSTPPWEQVKNTDEAYGDCYLHDLQIVIDPTNTKITFAGGDQRAILDSSQVSYKVVNGQHIIMCKIPKNLGPGFGFSYWEPTDSLIEGVRLTSGRVLGLHIAYTSFTGSTSPASRDIRPGNPSYLWSVLSEPTEFYTATLVNP